MRARSIRLLVMVLVIVGLALASLAFKNINIDVPGFQLGRGGSGPLGLKLGLDLRGGGHLVYQADTGTRIDVTFEEPTTVSEIDLAFAELDFSVSTQARSPTNGR